MPAGGIYVVHWLSIREINCGWISWNNKVQPLSLLWFRGGKKAVFNLSTGLCSFSYLTHYLRRWVWSDQRKKELFSRPNHWLCLHQLQLQSLRFFFFFFPSNDSFSSRPWKRFLSSLCCEIESSVLFFFFFLDESPLCSWGNFVRPLPEKFTTVCGDSIIMGLVAVCLLHFLFGCFHVNVLHFHLFLNWI